MNELKEFVDYFWKVSDVGIGRNVKIETLKCIHTTMTRMDEEMYAACCCILENRVHQLFPYFLCSFPLLDQTSNSSAPSTKVLFYTLSTGKSFQNIEFYAPLPHHPKMHTDCGCVHSVLHSFLRASTVVLAIRTGFKWDVVGEVVVVVRWRKVPLAIVAREAPGEEGEQRRSFVDETHFPPCRETSLQHRFLLTVPKS